MMNESERKALTTFMYMVFKTLHPNYDEYPLNKIERIYEEYSDESEEFSKFPDYQVKAFFMKRAIEVIRGEKQCL